MPLNFQEQVAIVTGAGSGLGRSHALALARRGVKVVVNDYGEASETGALTSAIEETLSQISEAGGEALGFAADVCQFTDVEQMVAEVMAQWGRIDILVNNAGIIRDKSFSKMSLEDFHKVIDVNLFGTIHCCKSVWDIMRSQQYGRIVMTASSSGLYGNFGQANYGTAKMALIGLMNTLVLEGEKYNIRVNTLAPAAATPMTEHILDEKTRALMSTDSVSEALLVLCHERAPNKSILCAGAGTYSCSQMLDSEGLHISTKDQNAENIVKNWPKISSIENASSHSSGNHHINKLIKKASF